MNKYRVSLATMAYLTVYVDAEYEEEAIDKAFDNGFYICAQCSGWGQEYSFDLGEWELQDEFLAAMARPMPDALEPPVVLVEGKEDE